MSLRHFLAGLAGLTLMLMSCAAADTRAVETSRADCAGSEGCECASDDGCGADMSCSDGVCESCPEGSDGCACEAQRACDSELSCDPVDDICRPPEGLTSKDLESGIDEDAAAWGEDG